jgi:5-methylcytosine-specific restriction endonuclease McrA
MPRPRRAVQDGKLFCPGCNRWLHSSKFRPSEKGHGTVARYHSNCRVCEQSDRNDAKNEDRAKAIVLQRAAVRAEKAGVPTSFFMEELNWKSLIGMVDAYLDKPERVLCPNCGDHYIGERDFQIDHREPPRHVRDWERLHARNCGPLCTSCNVAKSDRTYVDWLEDQEVRRLSVEAHYDQAPALLPICEQPGLW